MSAAWDSSPALSPVPWGERSREAFNCVPGDQQSAPLVNSFGVCEGAEPVHHRGVGSRRATNDAHLAQDKLSCEARGRGRRQAPVDRWGAPCRARPDTVAKRIALDHVGSNGDNWSVMIPLVPFAARSRST